MINPLTITFVAASILLAILALLLKRNFLTRAAIVSLSLVIALREFTIGFFGRNEIANLAEKQLLTEQFAAGMHHFWDYCDRTGYIVYLVLLFIVLVTLNAVKKEPKK